MSIGGRGSPERDLGGVVNGAHGAAAERRGGGSGVLRAGEMQQDAPKVVATRT